MIVCIFDHVQWISALNDFINRPRLGWAGFALLQYGVGPQLKAAEAPGAPLSRAATLGFAYAYGLCVVAAWRGVWQGATDRGFRGLT